MQWFTTFQIPASTNPISYQSNVITIGSCFAQTMGQKMLAHKFDCLVNPFGTLFNPISIFKILDACQEQRVFEETDIIERDGLFYHYSTHSDLVASSKAELISKLTMRSEKCKSYLAKCTHLILTFGSAWVYKLVESGQIVANCHKQAASNFKKRLLTLEQMEAESQLFINKLSERYPDIKIILTLSPVRHTKDGIQENQLSKSLLRVLCGNMESQFDQVTYFPAYEIMMDELRDYRFYKADLIHPTAEAENYIWEKWTTAYFSLVTQAKIQELNKIAIELAHRARNPLSTSHQAFLRKLLYKLERLSLEFDFSNEIKQVKDQLANS